MKKSCFLLLFFSTFLIQAGEELSLESYLSQVEKQHAGLQGAEIGLRGAEMKMKESNLLYSPQFFASAQENTVFFSAPSIFTRDKQVKDSFNFGITQQTFFGLQGKLSYATIHSNTRNQSPQVSPFSNFYEVTPTLELSLPLWRNFFGAEIQSQEMAIKFQNEAKLYAEKFKRTQYLVEAEVNYWKLALARDLVYIQREGLSRAEKIRDWVEKRKGLNLADQSDLLQTDAALKVRQFELQMAEQEEDNAALNFNLFLGKDGLDVPEKITSLFKVNFKDVTQKMPDLKKLGLRGDIYALQGQLKAQMAGTEVSKQKLKPTVEVYTSLGFDGQDPKVNKAVSEAFSAKYPNYAVGVRVATPLNFFTLNDVREGYAEEQKSLELSLRQKMLDGQKDLIDLLQRLSESQKKLNILKNLEEVQRKKASVEKERLSRGRTTTFQVLNFEQDYANAIVSLVRAEAEILMIMSQLKLYAAGEGVAL